MCAFPPLLGRWNPAPAARRLQGDLFYVEVVTLENHTLHITATSSGFFVNRTHRDTFNPLPQQPLAHAFSLVALLATVSPLFRKNYTQVCGVGLVAGAGPVVR